MIMEDIAAGG
jgi:hypothetical protein